MASVLYPKGKKKILDGDIDLLVNDIYALLIDTADETYNANDEHYSDLTGAGIVTMIGPLLSKTTTGGVFDAADIAYSPVTGDSVEAVIVLKWTGTPSTSPLIAWFDISTYTPTGSGATIRWDASGIFAI